VPRGKTAFICSFLCTLVSLFGLPQTLPAQSGDQYANLVAEAKADLDTGNLAKSLAESQSAIKLDPGRWQACISAAGALEQQKMFDAAVDNFTEALGRAPEDKRAIIKALLQKSMQEKLANGTAPQPPTAGTSVTGINHTVYTYANPNDYKLAIAGALPCSPNCNTSLQITEAGPIGPSRTVTAASVLSYVFTDGAAGDTLTPLNSSIREFSLSTNAAGAVQRWSIVITGMTPPYVTYTTISGDSDEETDGSGDERLTPRNAIGHELAYWSARAK